MPAISDHWSQLVDPRVREAFFLGFDTSDRPASLLASLFNIQRSELADEKVLPIGGIPSSGWNFEDSGRVQYTEMVKGYEETFTHHEFARGMQIERKLIDDNRIQQALDAAANLGDSAFRVREKAGANVFTNAFSSATSETLDDYGTDATGSDSVALCSTAHPRNPGESGTTDSNEGTSTLSKANVSTTRQLMAEFVDMSGDPLAIMPNELLVPIELEDTAIEIANSVLDPTSANNAVNPQSGRYRVIPWHYLTDSNAWFLMDGAYRRRCLRWFDRIPLEFARERDFDTYTAKWSAYMRFSLGFVDWRWVYGHNPS